MALKDYLSIGAVDFFEITSIQLIAGIFGRQSPWFYALFIDCPEVLRAVAIDEITINRLNAQMRTISHLCYQRRPVTSRVLIRAVAVAEITIKRLNARMRAVSHLCYQRRPVTARVLIRAVAFLEITF